LKDSQYSVCFKAASQINASGDFLRNKENTHTDFGRVPRLRGSPKADVCGRNIEKPEVLK